MIELCDRCGYRAIFAYSHGTAVLTYCYHHAMWVHPKLTSQGWVMTALPSRDDLAHEAERAGRALAL